jgi:hypothetical protein
MQRIKELLKDLEGINDGYLYASTHMAKEKHLFLKDLEGIIDGFRKRLERNNYSKNIPLARFYEEEKVGFLEPIFNMFKDIQERLEVLEKRS